MSETGKKRVVSMMRNVSTVQDLTDQDLVDAVVSEVWANLDIGKRPYALLHELMQRFEKAVGLSDDESGLSRRTL